MAEQKIIRPSSGWELLWTNPNPSADFAAQTVSIDLSRYDLIMILARVSADRTYLVPPTIIPKNSDGGMLSFTVFAGSNGWPHNLAQRTVSMVDDNGITFDDATQKPTNATTSPEAGNDLLIPYYIYGQSL